MTGTESLRRTSAETERKISDQIDVSRTVPGVFSDRL